MRQALRADRKVCRSEPEEVPELRWAGGEASSRRQRFNSRALVGTLRITRNLQAAAPIGSQELADRLIRRQKGDGKAESKAEKAEKAEKADKKDSAAKEKKKPVGKEK